MTLAHFLAYAVLSLALWYGLNHFLVASGTTDFWGVTRYTLLTLPILCLSQVLAYMAYNAGYRAFGDRIWLTQMGWWTISFVVSGLTGYVALGETPTRGTVVGLALMLAGITIARRF